VRELEALVLPLDDEGKDAVRQHKRQVDREYKARAGRFEEATLKRSITMDEKTWQTLFAGCHTDASEVIRGRARTVLEGYKKRLLTKKDAFKWPP
jgi:hypothetical protein